MKKGKHIKQEQGFTLLDIAIGLLILSLILVPLAQYYKNKIPKERRETTIAHQDNVHAAMDQYFYQHNSYPCPADPTLSAADEDFGEPVLADPLPPPDPDPAAASPCTGTVVEMPDPGDGTQIMAGDIPFKALKIPESYTYDAWGHKMTYIVSPDLTRKDIEFDETNAVLEAQRQQINDACEYDGGGNPVMNTETAQWILISHGPEGIGAYTKNGILIQNCPATGSSSETKETQNCDYITGDRTFLHQDCQLSLSDNERYFDDILSLGTGVSGKYWTAAPSDNEDIIGNVSKVGIHNTDPQVELDVVGNILVSEDSSDANKEGNIIADEICDTNDSNCFSPDLITGDHEEMRCSDTSVVKPSNVLSGIGNSAAECGVTIKTISGNCPSGHFVQGFNSDGSVICTP